MTPESFKSQGRQLGVRLAGSGPQLGPQFSVNVVQAPMQESQQNGPGGPVHLGTIMAGGGATKIPSTKQGPGASGREFTPQNASKILLRGRGPANEPLQMEPRALPQVGMDLEPLTSQPVQGHAEPQLSGSQEDAVVVEAHGRAPDGRVFVAKYEAVFPKGTTLLGTRFAG